VRALVDSGRVRDWVAQRGFAVLVGIAAIIGLVTGATVHPPADIPAVALQAAMVYRLEVGGALFLGFYLVAMAFVLALQSRGFTEIGTGGVRAESVVRVSRAFAVEESSLDALTEAIAEIKRRQKLEEGN
jgi:hypothetical protein